MRASGKDYFQIFYVYNVTGSKIAKQKKNKKF